MRITSDLLFGSADTPAIATPSANKFTNLSCDSEMYSKILFKFFVSFVSEEEEEEDDDDDDDDEGGATAFRLLFVGTKKSISCLLCVCV